MRSEFEAWAMSVMNPNLDRYGDGRYRAPHIDIAWSAWQAATKAASERLRQDARRYRWLREQPNDTSAPRIEVVYWTVADESANDGEGLRMEALDAAIDAAMLKTPNALAQGPGGSSPGPAGAMGCASNGDTEDE